jgi:ribonuclease E
MDAAIADATGPEEPGGTTTGAADKEPAVTEHLEPRRAVGDGASPAATRTEDEPAAAAPAETVVEDKAPEPAKPKKRGWWSLGL